MSTTATKETGINAINAFNAACKDSDGVRVWSYHHVQKPMGETCWSPAEYMDGLLHEAVSDKRYSTPDGWTEAEWDGEYLDLTHDTGWQYKLSYRATPDAGRSRVAYLGSHAGFIWEDESVASDALESLLHYLRWDQDAPGKFGLASCEDYDAGDDGGYWLVNDADKFAETAAKCKAIDVYDLDGEDIEWILDDRPDVD